MKKRILIVEPHHLGDALLAFPFLRGAASAEWDVHVLCRKMSEGIFRWILPQDRIHALPEDWDQSGRGWSLAPWKARLLALDAAGIAFDAAVCVWPDPRVEWFMAELARRGTKRRVGYALNRNNHYGGDRPWRRRRRWIGKLFLLGHGLFGGRPGYSKVLQRQTDGQHQLESWGGLATELGFSLRTELPWFSPPVSQQPRATQSERPLWIIHSGGRLPTKQWGDARFATAVELAGLEGRVDFCWVLPPDGHALDLVKDWPHSVKISANLDELAAIFEDADGVLCNDSFPAHLAAALGKSVVSVFGSGDPKWFSPFQNSDLVVASSVCPLRPCVDRCPFPTAKCLDAVRAEEVGLMLRKAVMNTGKRHGSQED